MKALTIKNIPDDVLQKFKAWCALHDKTMAQEVIEFMETQGSKLKVSEK